MGKKITIITINYNTSDFIELMLYSFAKLSEFDNKIIICDNGSCEQDLSNLDAIVKNYNELDVELVIREQSVPGSQGHGEALDIMVQKVNTPYFVTMDADAVMLAKQWDKVLLDSLLKDNSAAIGTPVVPNIRKKSDFPMTYGTMYQTDVFNSLLCSFQPGIFSDEKFEDTGFDVREKFQKNGFRSIIFDVINTRTSYDKYYNNTLCATYYFKKNIVCTHYGRGATGGYAKHKGIIYRIPVFGQAILKMVSLKEKIRWINTSRSIIDNQLKS